MVKITLLERYYITANQNLLVLTSKLKNSLTEKFLKQWIITTDIYKFVYMAHIYSINYNNGT